MTITLDGATRREILAQLEKAADVWTQEAEAAQFRRARHRAAQEARHARRMAAIFLDDDDPLRDRRFDAPQWPQLADAQAAQRIADAARGGGDACPTCGSGSPWRCGHNCDACGDTLDGTGACPSCADLPAHAGTEEPPPTIQERQAAAQRMDPPTRPWGTPLARAAYALLASGCSVGETEARLRRDHVVSERRATLATAAAQVILVVLANKGS